MHWCGRVSVLCLVATTGVACSSDTQPDVPACMCFSGPSNELTVTCEVESCGTVREPTDCAKATDGQIPEGCYEDAETNNAEVVQCVLELLASGQPGEFRYQSSTGDGAFITNHNYLTHGDGTIVKWDESFQDAIVWFSAVEPKEVPDAAVLESCPMLTGAFEQWECIEGAITAMPTIAECTPAAEGGPGR